MGALTTPVPPVHPSVMTAGNVADTRSARVREITEAHLDLRGPLLPVLHAVNDELGHIERGDVAVVADVLNIAVAEVHGVVTFYEDFRTAPAGRSTVRICRAEACQAVGAEALADHATRALGVGFGETTDDGGVTLDEVFCLGNCALGPSVQVDGVLRGRVTPARLDAILGDAVTTGVRAPRLGGPLRRGRRGRRADRGRGRGPWPRRGGGAQRLAGHALARAARGGGDRSAAGSGYGPVEPERGRRPRRRGRCCDGHRTRPRARRRDLDWLRRQQRLTFARVGVVDPARPDDYERARRRSPACARRWPWRPEDVVEAVVASGLRGRGGAGFPAGIKWRTVARRRRPT